MKSKYYEIYTNRHQWFTPAHYEGIVIVLNEETDELIEQWCKKKMGNMYQVVKGRGLIKIWNWMSCLEDNDRTITTIQRKV